MTSALLSNMLGYRLIIPDAFWGRAVTNLSADKMIVDHNQMADIFIRLKLLLFPIVKKSVSVLTFRFRLTSVQI